MLKCKNCGEKLTKFNKEICPYCGFKEPFDEEDLETDTTGRIDIVSVNSTPITDYEKKSMKRFVFLTSLAGFSGAGFFYIKRKTAFIVSLLFNICLLLGFALVFYFSTKNIFLTIILPIVIDYIINIIFSFLVYKRLISIHDNNGEFLD